MKQVRTYSLYILMVLFPVFVFSQTPAYVPEDGLAAWWSFEGNADDASTNMNHGQVSGATLTTDRFGIPDRAYFFDGVNDYIRINDAPSLQIKDEITISAWFSVNKWYTNPIWGDLHFPVLCKSTSNNKYALYNLTVMPKTVLGYLKGKGGKRTGLTTTLNEWMHVVITVSEGFITFYVNGVFTGMQAVTNEIGVLSGVVENDPLYLGNNIPGQTEWANGKLDDIGIWKRALTLQEIKNLYYGDVVCTHPDYDGLMSLYYATGGPSWKNNDGWETGAEGANCDPCTTEWYGIKCENGRVSEIQLEDNHLKGSLPDFSLSNITKFNCASNQLSGSIPAFSSLPNLQYFDCSINMFTGSIPASSFMERFTTFNCADNRLTGKIPVFTNQKFLEFNCSNNMLTGDIPDFDIHSNECSINCSNNALGGLLPEIINYPSMTFIDFSNNRLAGCIPSFYCDILSGPGSVNLSDNTMLPYQGDINTFCQNVISENAPCDDGFPYTSGDIIQPDCRCLGISTDSNIVSIDIDNSVCGISGQETQVPVRVYQYRNITEVSFAILSSDNAVAEISGVAGIHPLSGITPSDFKLDNQILSLMYSGDLHSLPDSAVLFYVRIRLAGGADSKANIIFKEQVTVKKENQQDVEVLTASGSVCIARNASVIACASDANIPGAPIVGDECGLLVQPTEPEKGGTYDGCGGTITYTWTYRDCLTNELKWTYTYILSDPKTLVTCTQRTEICLGEYFSSEIQYEIGCNIAASVSYEISGATVRSGAGTDASGAFNVGSSLIRWKIDTPCDTTFCETEVSVLPRILSDTSVFVCDSFTWKGTTYTQSGEYTFTRTNSSGCEDLERLNLTVGKRVAPTLYVTACESYLWNDSLYSASGIYTYGTINNSGCDSISVLDLTIISSPCDEILQPILNIENDVCGGPGDLVCVPVRAFKYSGIAAFQLGIISLDTAIAEIKGICQVNPELEASSFDFAIVGNSLHIIYADNESSLPDSSILFSLEVKLKSTPGSTVRLLFQDSIRAQGYDFDVVRMLGVSGSVCISQKSSFVSGQIINPIIKGIPKVDVRALPNSTVIKSDQDGYYLIESLLNGMTYQITPSYSEPVLKGVDVADLLIMKRHLLGISPLLSPYAFVAADLNFNRSVELGDLLYLQRLLSGMVDTLPGNVNSWRFIPRNFNFLPTGNPLLDVIPDHILISHLLNNQINQDFIGVKYGDLNSSAATNPYSHTDIRGASEPALFISGAEGSAGEDVWIDVTCKNFTGGAAMQFSLVWPADKLALVSVPDDRDEIRIEGTTSIDKRFINRGLLSFIWESEDVLEGSTVPDNTICYRLKFRILDSQAGKADIGSTSAIRSSKFVNGNLEEFDLAVETGKVAIAESSVVEQDYSSVGVYPNPTTDILHLKYGSHTPQAVTLQTMEGMVLRKISGRDKTMDLSGLTAGVYLVKMQFNLGMVTRKVIVIK